MCGIVGIHFKNPRDKGISQKNLEQLVNELLLGIEHRGGDATGLLTVDTKGVPNLVKADTRASTFVNFRDAVPRRVRTVLGHTRLATQGTPQNLDNNHPVQYETCFAIHNGHISNDSELFKEHSLGRIAEVDSEIIPALFHKYGLDKAHLALQELEGGFATAVVDPDRFPNMTVLAKGWNSPCEVLDTKHAVIWASEARAIQDACDAVLGFKPSLSAFKALHEGDVLLMEGETVEFLEFEPKARYAKKSWTYTSNPSTTHYNRDGYSIYEYETSGDRLDELCKSCGCKRLHHGLGVDFSGACRYVHIEQSVGSEDKYEFPCKCEAWVEPKTQEIARGEAWEYCDGCGRQFYIGDLIRVGHKYLCPGKCAKDPAVKDEVQAAMKAIKAKSEDTRFRAECVLAAQVAAADEFNVDELAEQAWEARKLEFNAQVCEMAAEKTGMHVHFIDWLVNDCAADMAESDTTGYLADARRQAGKAYFNAWALLDDELNEIEQSRWDAGDYKVGDACDTPLEIEGEAVEECPYGVEGCFGDVCDDCWTKDRANVISIHNYPAEVVV